MLFRSVNEVSSTENESKPHFGLPNPFEKGDDCIDELTQDWLNNLNDDDEHKKYEGENALDVINKYKPEEIEDLFG